MTTLRWAALLLAIAPGAVFSIEEAVTLEGQVVCSECWGEQDRHEVPYGNKFDLECAETCANSGKPRALAVREGAAFVLYRLAPGGVDAGPKPFLDLVPHRARVTGVLREVDGQRSITVKTIEKLVAQNPTPAPSGPVDLELRTLTGVAQQLAALRGQIVVLNFWSTTCVPCVKEMPLLARIQRDFAALGVQVVGAATDPADRQAAVARLVQQRKASYLQWVGATLEQMDQLGLGAAIPATAIIGRDGRIVRRLIGALEEKPLRHEIEALLAEEAKDRPGPSARVRAEGASSVPS